MKKTDEKHGYWKIDIYLWLWDCIQSPSEFHSHVEIYFSCKFVRKLKENFMVSICVIQPSTIRNNYVIAYYNPQRATRSRARRVRRWGRYMEKISTLYCHVRNKQRHKRWSHIRQTEFFSRPEIQKPTGYVDILEDSVFGDDFQA